MIDAPLPQILQIGDRRLRAHTEAVPADDIAAPDTQRLIDQLIATMRAAGGAGLAANQIGDNRRVCVIEVGDNPRYPYKPPIPLTVLVNPRLTPLTDEQFENNEGCLSVPNLRGNVMRYTEIRVSAFDRLGQPYELDVSGLSAGTYQHECDHLDGILFVDHVRDPTTLATWDEFTRHQRGAYLERVETLVSRYGQ
jgi:peptide deformylase